MLHAPNTKRLATGFATTLGHVGGGGNWPDSNECSAQGVIVSTIDFDNNLDLSVVFATNNPTDGDNNPGGPFTVGRGNDRDSIAPGNVQITQENDHCDVLSCTTADHDCAGAGCAAAVFDGAWWVGFYA